MVIFLGYLTLILVGCTVGGTRRRVTHTPTTARLNTNRFHIYSFPHFLVAFFFGGGGVALQLEFIDVPKIFLLYLCSGC